MISKRAKVISAATALVVGLVFNGCAATGAPESASKASAANSTNGTTASAGTTTGTTAETITETTAAAEAFEETLSKKQIEKLTYDYTDETKSTSWSNFPVTFVRRAGLDLDDLTKQQRTAAMNVLDALLNDRGYDTVTGIIEGDEFLLEHSESSETSLGRYFIAFFGDPSDSGAWEVQFGGHHLGINATLNGSDSTITFAPTHLGSQPASFTDRDGNRVRPLAGMYQAAFAFYDSLSDNQRAKLYQGSQVSNLVCALGGTCEYPTGTGLRGSELNDVQQRLLLDLAANWVGLSDEETTAKALDEIEATLDSTYVNWSGATEYDTAKGQGISFQISGPDAYIEFSNQQGSAGADVEGYLTSGWGHIHTIYRDPSNDYAGSVSQQAANGPGEQAGPGGPSGRDGGAPPANPDGVPPDEKPSDG